MTGSSPVSGTKCVRRGWPSAKATVFQTVNDGLDSRTPLHILRYNPDMESPFVMLGVVRLLVQEKSGAWWVDQGFMKRSRADQRRAEWKQSGFRTLILKHSMNPGLKIVHRPVAQLPPSWAKQLWGI